MNVSNALPSEDDVDEPITAVVEVDADFVRQVDELLAYGEDEKVRELVLPLHAADQAYLIDFLPSDDRERLMLALGDAFDPQLLSNLNSDLAAEVVEYIGEEAAASAISTLETDEAIWVLEDMGEESQQALLEHLPKLHRQKVEEGLAYPESSAGRMMRKKMVLAPEYWSVGNAIDYLRHQEHLPEEFYSVFVVDARNRPVGFVLLSQIIRSKREVMLRDLMNTQLRSITVDMDQEDVAHLFKKYSMISAPVVHESGRVLGMITIDDVAEVIEEEADEDLLRMGGVKEQDFYSATSITVRRRFPWLFVNLLTAILASAVIAMFEGIIEQMVALAVLMPIVASMGGNAGTQAMTVAVRAIATRELGAVNAWRSVGKEMLVGGVNGLLFAIICSAVVFAWYQDMVLALVFGGATVVTLTVAGFAGAMIPVMMDRFNIDPAVSSGVFLTTVTDVAGFLAFLGMAALILL